MKKIIRLLLAVGCCVVIVPHDSTAEPHPQSSLPIKPVAADNNTDKKPTESLSEENFNQQESKLLRLDEKMKSLESENKTLSGKMTGAESYLQRMENIIGLWSIVIAILAAIFSLIEWFARRKSEKELKEQAEKLKEQAKKLEDFAFSYLELKLKSANYIDDIKLKYAENLVDSWDDGTTNLAQLTKQLTTDLLRLEKVLRAVTSDDDLKVFENLKSITGFFMDKDGKFEKAVQQYLAFLENKNKFKDAALTYYTDKIMGDFFDNAPIV